MLEKRKFMAGVVLAGIAVAGVSMVKATAGADTGLENSAWVLEELNGEPLPPMPEGWDRAAGIEFGEDGRFSATAGCNMFNGTAEISGAQLQFPDQMASTMMACPPPLDTTERALGEALSVVAEMRIEDSRLVLLNAEGAEVMGLRAAE